MSYITLAVSTNIKSIANKICVCLEPDPSIRYDNYEAFIINCIGIENNENDNIIKSIPNKLYYAYGSEVKDWLLQSVFEWKNNPELLYNSIKEIYLNRWNVETDLTLQNCVEFCSDVLISDMYGINSGLLSLNLEIIENYHDIEY